tara:strand:+ start:1710 stop:4097 length:2388 start_codon:yes stop_codon:yes gene_type:complete
MDIYKKSTEKDKIVAEFLRYLNFWPWILLSLIFSISTAYIFLRYAQYDYLTSARIEILDKAQDSEMALPTSMTIFNRSMINLENEIGVLSSYSLNKKVTSSLKANVKYYTIGTIKTSQDHPDEWFDDYNLTINFDTDTIEETLEFEIEIFDGYFTIKQLNSDVNINVIKFNKLTTIGVDHNFPFDLSLLSAVEGDKKKLVFHRIEDAVKSYTQKLNILAQSDNSYKSSDQLDVSLTHNNRRIAEDYINRLILEFDRDGIRDRQFEYKRTMDFVDSRSSLIRSELEQIEVRKSDFKRDNNLSNLESDASNIVQEQINYNNELFTAESQKDLSEILKESVLKQKYDYMPANIGLESEVINNIIAEHNNLIREREVFLISAGSNNSSVINIERQIDNYVKSIVMSIENYQKDIDIKIDNLKSKETELASFYSKVPENEKILRSIERELNIKEALFLLLLQKREEAAINYAVIKPSIKIIDSSISGNFPVSPNKLFVYLISFSLGFIIPILIIYFKFLFDNKVHTKFQLAELLNSEIPIISEIPYIPNPASINNIKTKSRNVIAESVRMLISNLLFTSSVINSRDSSEVIIFTSSIKGEGKTLVSVNSAINLANDFKRGKKVILLGADLRNPQVHKSFGVEKSKSGISNIIYKNDFKNYKNYIKRFDNLDVLFSGSIPPNPTAMLSGEVFKNLINLLKLEYDYIIIDSAPCLLVSDTFQFINLADSVVFLFRSNFTDSKVTDFINETYLTKKIKNFNIVLNAVGNSAGYGYKYGYQYGYKYGYKYSYNYGYGYGYGTKK